MATARFRFVSVARYTSPMPPTPSWAPISYGRVGCQGAAPFQEGILGDHSQMP